MRHCLRGSSGRHGGVKRGPAKPGARAVKASTVPSCICKGHCQNSKTVGISMQARGFTTPRKRQTMLKIKFRFTGSAVAACRWCDGTAEENLNDGLGRMGELIRDTAGATLSLSFGTTDWDYNEVRYLQDALDMLESFRSPRRPQRRRIRNHTCGAFRMRRRKKAGVTVGSLCGQTCELKVALCSSVLLLASSQISSLLARSDSPTEHSPGTPADSALISSHPAQQHIADAVTLAVAQVRLNESHLCNHLNTHSFSHGSGARPSAYVRAHRETDR